MCPKAVTDLKKGLYSPLAWDAIKQLYKAPEMQELLYIRECMKG